MISDHICMWIFIFLLNPKSSSSTRPCGQPDGRFDPGYSFNIRARYCIVKARLAVSPTLAVRILWGNNLIAFLSMKVFLCRYDYVEPPTSRKRTTKNKKKKSDDTHG